MKLLLIEDDKNMCKSLQMFLKEKNIILDLAYDGEDGLNKALINKYDLILLDYGLPTLNGEEIIKKIRKEKNDVPIIMITVEKNTQHKIELLNLGADDYLNKPFSITELLARIKAVLRRPKIISDDIIVLKNLEIDLNKLTVKKNGKLIKLRAKEFSLLAYLMRHKSYVMSRQDIMENVWDENADPFSNTIEVHIMKLRRKLENKKDKFIFTYANRGYKIDEHE